jgi:hypothetical protein
MFRRGTLTQLMPLNAIRDQMHCLVAIQRFSFPYRGFAAVQPCDYIRRPAVDFNLGQLVPGVIQLTIATSAE